MGSKLAAPPRQDLMGRTRDGLFDFRHTSSFAERYLKTFYTGRAPTNDERVVFRFLADQVKRLEGQPVLLEVGCGPTVHHALPIAPYVSEIHMADYLEENLEEVRKWRDGAPGAGTWSQYAELAQLLDAGASSPETVHHLERLTREKLRQLLLCDLRDECILGAPAEYQAVTAFYCTEEVGITKTRWEEVMGNLARLVAPGGHLFLSCLRDTDFYVVDGSAYPCARISEADVRRVLPELGFEPSSSVVESASVDGQEDEGVFGVVLVAARKAARR
jgi:hypothetical protein